MYGEGRMRRTDTMKMEGVREYAEGYPVELSSCGDRLVVSARGSLARVPRVGLDSAPCGPVPRAHSHRPLSQLARRPAQRPVAPAPKEPEKPARKTRKAKRKKSDRKRTTTKAATRRTTAKVAMKADTTTEKKTEDEPGGGPVEKPAKEAADAAQDKGEGASQ